MFTSLPLDPRPRYAESASSVTLGPASKSRYETSESPAHAMVSLYSLMAALAIARRGASNPAHAKDAATASITDRPIIPVTGKTVPELGQ